MHPGRQQNLCSDVPLSKRAGGNRLCGQAAPRGHPALRPPCRVSAPAWHCGSSTVPQATDTQLQGSFCAPSLPTPLSHQSSWPASVRWEGQCGAGVGAGHGVAPSRSSGGLCSESDSAMGRRVRPLWEKEGRALLPLKDQGPRMGGPRTASRRGWGTGPAPARIRCGATSPGTQH